MAAYQVRLKFEILPDAPRPMVDHMFARLQSNYMSRSIRHIQITQSALPQGETLTIEATFTINAEHTADAIGTAAEALRWELGGEKGLLDFQVQRQLSEGMDYQLLRGMADIARTTVEP